MSVVTDFGSSSTQITEVSSTSSTELTHHTYFCLSKQDITHIIGYVTGETANWKTSVITEV
jgi:hypothetical protein